MINIKKKSSNYFEKGLEAPKYIVIHCCGFSPAKALEVFDQHQVSTHFFLPDPFFLKPEERNDVYQLVEEEHIAFHAGQSQYLESADLSKLSIGIEFNVAHYANAHSHEKGATQAIDFLKFAEFNPQQIEIGIQLIKALMLKHGIPPENVLGHSDIAAWREIDGKIVRGKTDPGPHFPWQQLAKHGIGCWPSMKRTRTSELDLSLLNFQRLLSELGYPIDCNSELDKKTEYTFTAFMWHYFPDHCIHNEKCIPKFQITEEKIIALENLNDKHYPDD